MEKKISFLWLNWVRKRTLPVVPPPRIFENQYFQNSLKYILLEFKREFICLVAKSDCTSNCFNSLKRTYWLIEIGGGRKCVRQGPIGCCQSCSYLWLDKLLFSSKILVWLLIGWFLFWSLIGWNPFLRFLIGWNYILWFLIG